MTEHDHYPLHRVEQAGWSWRSCGFKAAGIALLSVILATKPVSADDLGVLPQLSIKPAFEVHYSAGPGQVYELQGSDDLRAWRDLNDPVFGHGGTVGHLFSPTEPGDLQTEFRYYRVKISPSQAFGFAPTQLSGKVIELNDDGSPRRLRFDSRSTGSTGTAGDEPFLYSYRKLGDARGEMTIRRGSGTDSSTENLTVDFVADLVGNYTRSVIRGGVVRDIDSGTFALVTGSDPGLDPSAAVIPESLVGCTFLFSDATGHERLDFVTASGGRAVDRAEVTHFTYEYLETAATGKATVFYPGEFKVEFEMTFCGGSCGTYLRREFADGVLEASDAGIFNCANSVYHSRGADSTNVTLPADALTGQAYIIRDGGTPLHLQFQTPSTGTCTEGSRVDPFEFDYAVKCNATSTVTLRFGSGNYDEYHLNHTDGTFLRHEVRDGQQVDSDTGTFSESR